MTDPIQVRLSGSGGQGLITAGIILAEAAMLEGKNVVQTQIYGPEARLGSSRAEVIISTKQIAYPEATKPDVVLCMSNEAARKYGTKVAPETIVILDSTCVGADVVCGGCVIRLPITEAAVTTGNKVVANTVALGALNSIAAIVQAKTLEQAVSARVPARFAALNRKALEAGIALAQQSDFASVHAGAVLH